MQGPQVPSSEILTLADSRVCCRAKDPHFWNHFWSVTGTWKTVQVTTGELREVHTWYTPTSQQPDQEIGYYHTLERPPAF